MPYRHETCLAGKTKQHTYYYSARADTKEGSRRKKKNETSEAQKKVNSRHAEKKLTWIMNANFDGTSLYVTYEYRKDNRPKGKEQLRADVNKLLRDIRKEFSKEGRQAKYIWVAEVGERGAVHIHITLNAIDIQKLKKCWDKGWIHIKPMDESGQYRRLASYFVKYSEKTMKTCEGFTGRRYNSSKNLIIPEPKKTTVSSRNAYNHTIQVPPGWHLDKDSIREAWHEVTGYPYFTYTLIYDGQTRKEDELETYPLELEAGEVLIREKRKATQKKTVERKAAKRKGGGCNG
ncbi:MAG TPA: hypothetical protein H9761_17120 [Candidatus Eisenbergiella merdavium]|uniref:Replication-associated protein ORF2/G2P domain-containing protein n=1 Tax=Candidatus Eisenbergiella merdavium TaxID=2838551 RepID=A0A9D2NJ68_9FIRM|nr:hypothetical protein [Candidatus Eisenbergiella merdavium]